MQLVLVTVGLLLSGGLAALLTDSLPRVCRTLSVGGAIMGCLVGLVPTLKVMMGRPVESLAIERASSSFDSGFLARSRSEPKTARTLALALSSSSAAGRG